MASERLLFSSLAAFMLLPMVACSRDDRPSSAPSSIIGDDGRIETQSDILESTVGQLIVYGRRCTAFVSGPNELTTAAHCINGDTSNKLAIQFILRDQHITSGIRVASLDRSSDLARLRVDRGFTSHLTLGHSIDGPVHLAGLEPVGDRRLLSSECSLSHSQTRGLLAHQCDTVEGMSGAPILSGDYVVGMHLGSAKDRRSNVALDLTLRDGSISDVQEAEYLVEGCWTACVVSTVGGAISGAVAGAGSLLPLGPVGAAVGGALGGAGGAMLGSAAGGCFTTPQQCADANIDDVKTEEEFDGTQEQKFFSSGQLKGWVRIPKHSIPLVEGWFRQEGKPEVFYSNGVDAYCYVSSQDMIGWEPRVFNFNAALATRFRYDGWCQ